MAGHRMPRPNEALTDFFSDNHIFTDLFNTCIFQGEQVLNADGLQTVDTSYVQTLDTGHDTGILYRRRPMVWSGVPVRNAGTGRTAEAVCARLSAQSGRCGTSRIPVAFSYPGITGAVSDSASHLRWSGRARSDHDIRFYHKPGRNIGRIPKNV